MRAPGRREEPKRTESRPLMRRRRGAKAAWALRILGTSYNSREWKRKNGTETKRDRSDAEKVPGMG